MSTTKKMSQRAIEIRDAMLTEAAAKYGHDILNAWADDAVKRSMINAMAQSEADAEAKLSPQFA